MNADQSKVVKERMIDNKPLIIICILFDKKFFQKKKLKKI